MKKFFAILITAVLSVGILSGCGSRSEPAPTDERNPPSEESGGGYRIALSNSYIGNTWRAVMINTANSYIERYKSSGKVSEFYVTSSDQDAEAQINEIRTLMSQGYDCILVDCASATALAPVCEEAIERGIQIVTFDNCAESEETYNVIQDHVEYGRMQAQWLVDQLGGKGNIIMLKGLAGSQVTENRVKGYEEVLANYPDINVLVDGYTNWVDADCAVLMNDMLTSLSGTKIDGILNEGGTENAVVKALLEHNYDPASIPMTGDMYNGFFRNMSEHGLTAFATGCPTYIVCDAIDTALAVLDGEAVEHTIPIETPSGSNEELDTWYYPEMDDSFICVWTDGDNSYDLKLEDCYAGLMG